MNRSRIMHAAIGVAAIGLTGWLLLQWWPADKTSPAAMEPEPSSQTTLVHLTAAKASVAGIRCEPVERRDLVLTKTVPGRFVYDNRRHLAIRTPADGVIDRLLVRPGDHVTAGQSLATLRSPAIGEARSEVLRCRADLDLLEARRIQMANIQDGVANLITSLRAGSPPETIERELSDSTLGQYRTLLLANHSKLQLANQLAASATESQGAISGRIVQERVSQQQQARAELDGAVEQATFETAQAVQEAEADVDAAKRSLSIAKQKLAMVLGVHANQSEALTISSDEGELTRLEITSPIDGSVEKINYSVAERISGGDELFIVADTSQLWVEADIRGREWDAVEFGPGRPLRVTTPAEPETVMTAKLYFVGREVDPSTGAIPLVAEIANDSGVLRPGLFARVEIPIQTIDDTLVIARSAVVDLQGESSVFIAAGNDFQPVAVQTGASTEELIEVRSGLQEGQQVVVEGAFMLKSELLLEGEE